MTLPFIQIGEAVSKVDKWNPAQEGRDGTFAYIDLGSVNNETKQIEATQEVQFRNAPSRARQLVREGDILVSTVRPNLNGVARVTKAHDGATASTGFCVLRANPAIIDPGYLFQWVKSPNFVAEMVRRATGASYPAVTDRIIGESLIPFPPLDDQRRISAILDQADDVRRKRREAVARLSHIKRSIFFAMFGNPLINDRQWEVFRLGELCESITDIDHKMPKSVDVGVPFISAKDLVDEGISFSDVKMISKQDFVQLSRKGRPRRGDIIYSRIGAKLGKARLVSVDFDFLASYSCCTIRPNRDLVNELYLCELLDSPWILKQAHRGVRAIGVPDLGLGEIKNFKIIVPPLDMQSRFAAHASEVEKLKSLNRSQLGQVDALFATLQHRAFRGSI